jgi:hypothetical protein
MRGYLSTDPRMASSGVSPKQRPCDSAPPRGILVQVPSRALAALGDDAHVPIAIGRAYEPAPIAGDDKDISPVVDGGAKRRGALGAHPEELRSFRAAVDRIQIPITQRGYGGLALGIQAVVNHDEPPVSHYGVFAWVRSNLDRLTQSRSQSMPKK